MPAEFDVSCASDGQVEVVTVRGEIDTATVTRIEAVLQDCLDKADAHVLADYRSVEFRDSVGRKLLLDVYRKLHAEDRRLVVLADPAMTRRSLAFRGLELLIPVYDDFDAAAAAAAGEAG